MLNLFKGCPNSIRKIAVISYPQLSDSFFGKQYVRNLQLHRSRSTKSDTVHTMTIASQLKLQFAETTSNSLNKLMKKIEF